MNLPELKQYEDQAIDIVVNILNQAKFKFRRQNLFQLAKSRDVFAGKYNISLHALTSPLAKTSEKLVVEVIEKHWKLTPTFKYIVKYSGSSVDETATYYYFEAVFSQPTVMQPIPQATASVFFRIEDKHTESPEIRGTPKMHFRLEGHNADHDVRNVYMSPDRILGIIKMKIKLFRRIEAIGLF